MFVKETHRYQKGDRVLLTETQQIGLVLQMRVNKKSKYL